MIPTLNVNVHVGLRQSLSHGQVEEFFVSIGIVGGKRLGYHHFYSEKLAWNYIWDTLDDWGNYRLYDREDELDDLFQYEKHSYINEECIIYGCRIY